MRVVNPRARLSPATASVTDLIERLSAKGFMQRERDAVDQRRVFIRSVVEKLREARHYFVSTAEPLARFFADFGDDELETIATILRRNVAQLFAEADKVEQLDAMNPPEVHRAYQ